MPNHSRQRKAMLKRLYELTSADPKRHAGIFDLIGRDKVEQNATRIILNQLVEDGLAIVEHEDVGGGGYVRILGPGIHEIEKMDEKVDIVEHVNNTLRKHPIGGWAVIGFFVLVALATLINQAIGIIKTWRGE